MMNIRAVYYADLYLAFSIRAVLFFSMITILGVMLGGCSADSDRARALDLAVKGTYIPGDATQTRNQPPQGGIDEKSGVTPTKPMERSP